MFRPLTALTALVALGALAACGTDDPVAAPATDNLPTSTTSTTSTTVVRPEQPVDELVGVRGGRLHLRCDGAGDTTIVLVAGFTDGGDQWGPMQSTLAEETRVCTYARFGTGTSDPAASDQTFATEAEDLRAVLDTAGEPGPYLLVGHSFGGAEAVTFADRYPDDVAALALIDASPAGWYDAVCSVADDGTEAARNWDDLCASLTDPAANTERLDGPAAFTGVAAVDDLGDLPMAVITAADRTVFAGTASSEVERLTGVWNAGQADWAGLSTSSHVVTVDGVGHHVHLERPDLVVDQIRQLLP